MELIIIDIFMYCCIYYWRRWYRGVGNRYRVFVFSMEFGKWVFGGIGFFFGVFEFMLYFVVFGKVDSGDFFL